MPELQAFQAAFGTLLAQPPAIIGDPVLRRALAVHRNTAAKAAGDALAANYPVVEALVGYDAFGAIAAAFVAGHPPGDPRLCFYGARFADFAAAWPAFAGLPYLAAVAEVERRVTLALFATDARPLDPAMLATGIDAESPIILHPAAAIAVLDWPAASIWGAHQPGADADQLERLSWQPEIVLVTRPHQQVDVIAVDAATLAFLTAPTLGAAAIAATEAGGDVAGIFATLLTAGALARF